MSSLRVTVAPALDPILLAEAKAQCRIDTSDEDGLLAGFIIAAREHCEDETGRAFITQTMELKLDFDWPIDRCGNDCIVLPRPPHKTGAIESITYIDTNGVEQTLDASQYLFSEGDIFGCVRPAYGVTWPIVRDQVDAITVTFVAGYGSNPGDVPEPIRQAVRLMIGHFNENREAVSAGQETPLAVERLLRKYLTNW